MVPAGLEEKLGAFIARRQAVIADLVTRIIASGRSPEDVIFVIPAEDAASQEVAATMFGLEEQASRGPLPSGFVVGKEDFFATRGSALERCEPNLCQMLRQRTHGEAKVLAVVEGCFCGVVMTYFRGGGPRA